MTEVANLAADARDRVGKGAVRALRRGGRVPAVIYGDKKDPLTISVDRHALDQELQQPGFFRRLYDISLNGSKHRVLPRDVQLHPVTDAPLHVDFLHISAGARINVAVVVIFANEEESPGLKRGGVLNVVRRDIELVCPATAIPEALHVDLTGLDIGDSVHISDITLPPDCTPTITDRDFTVATIAAPTVIREEEEAAEAAEGEEAEAVEGEAPAEEGAREQAGEEKEKEKENE
ncbi:MAG: 50S ribosomal protein L25/general stress protein Ctc [Alphaproteobacteria bacterium]